MFEGVHDLTGLVAVSLIFGMPAIILIAVLLYKAHRVTMLRETIEHMVDKGQQVPPEMLKSLQDTASRGKSPLRTGIVLTALGLGMLIMFLSGGESMQQRWGIAMIPLLLGLGFLLMWKLDGREEK
ncbi:MAG TPA: DUF6249 domain-containing protein [Paucimonas sp.]|nr:DUF6249 domain-containing protein [Paucimonas sp.]